MNHGMKLHQDGTLEITIPKGKKVGRVLVCEEGTQNGGLYYPDEEPERKKGRWIDTGSGQECSECHETQYGYDSFRYFCAFCGAEMEGV